MKILTKEKKLELIKIAKNISSSEFFKQDEFLMGEEFRMSKLVDMVLEEVSGKATLDVPQR